MAQLESTYHFDGDGCAESGPYRRVEFVRAGAKPERGMCFVEDLEEGDVWRDLPGWGGDARPWWYANEIAELAADLGDEVETVIHIEFSSAPDPHG
jgi:hypothetical protein